MTKRDNLHPLPPSSNLAAVGTPTLSSSASPTVFTPSTSPRSQASSRPHSPLRSILATSKTRVSPPPRSRTSTPVQKVVRLQDPKDFSDLSASEDEEKEGDGMSGSARPPFHRPTEGRSQQPLLGGKDKDERGRDSLSAPNGSARPPFHARRATFRSRSPDTEGANAVRQKYIYATFFLILSLVSFVIQTETAVYIQHELKWKKAYAMLYFTHGSWSLLWPAQLLILRLTRWRTPWRTFWRRHVAILRSTAQTVQSGQLHLTGRESTQSPFWYMVRTMAIVTCSLTVAGGSWYVAVDLTSASDLTAIYNCSAFFAYAFSIPLLGDKLRFDKVFAVAVAIAGVMVVAYGDSATAKHGGKSGGSVGGGEDAEEATNRTLGNIIIGVGSVLYGLYEVLYKKLACPPEGTSPGRGMIFANLFGSLIGLFTLFVLWIPLPILHLAGIETFVFPTGKVGWVLLISVLANATFSGSFLVLISLTSPVLSSVAALLTIFMVALADWAFMGKKLSPGAIAGGILIIAAFILLSWATYREMVQERQKNMEAERVESDEEDE